MILVTAALGDTGGNMIWMAPTIAFLGLAAMALSVRRQDAHRYKVIFRVGEIMFFCGLLAYLLAAPTSMHLYHW